MPKGAYERNPEVAKKISATLKGRPLSQKTRENMSQTRTEKYPIASLIGKKFGRLTILEETSRGSRNERRLLVSCECGSPSYPASKNSVLQGSTLSCGCLREENIRKSRWEEDRPERGFKTLLSQYKNNAKKRDLSWELTEDEFRILTKSDCWYTGRKPSSMVAAKGSPDSWYVYNGIDRLDNTKGYTTENCVPCCSDVNLAKRSLSLKDFLILVGEVYKHKISKEMFGDL